jgi:hypothetical protein
MNSPLDAQLKVKLNPKEDNKDFLIKIVDRVLDEAAKAVEVKKKAEKEKNAKEAAEKYDAPSKFDVTKDNVDDQEEKPDLSKDGQTVRWFRPIFADYLEDGVECNTPRWNEVDATEIRQEWFIIPKTKEEYLEEHRLRKVAEAKAREAGEKVERAEVMEVDKPVNKPVDMPATVPARKGAETTGTFQVAWRNPDPSDAATDGSETATEKSDTNADKPKGKEIITDLTTKAANE